MAKIFIREKNICIYVFLCMINMHKYIYVFEKKHVFSIYKFEEALLLAFVMVISQEGPFINVIFSLISLTILF